MVRRGMLVAAVTALAALAWPAGSQATVSCTNAAGTLSVVFEAPTAANETATVYALLDFDNIQISGTDGGLLDCAGPDPTTENVDTIEIEDQSGDEVRAEIWNATGFAPGATDAGDVSLLNPDEIEFNVDLGVGLGDELFVLEGDPADEAANIRYGVQGINWNVHGSSGPITFINDVDLTPADVETHEVDGSVNSDVISGAGGAATGEAFPYPLRILSSWSSFDGSDRVTGGDGNDFISGGEGKDKVTGGPGKDELLGGDGKDLLKAKDGVKDEKISCGKGPDRAKVDAKDPNPKSC